nr:MAG TPA: hypothetical protein [Caudoviricetes sp.]
MLWVFLYKLPGVLFCVFVVVAFDVDSSAYCLCNLI